jgi:hypothetical protein
MAGSQTLNKLQKERRRKDKLEESRPGDWNGDAKSPHPLMRTRRQIQ